MKYHVTLLRKDGGTKDAGVIEVPGKKALSDKGLEDFVEKKGAEFGYRIDNGRVFFGNANVSQISFRKIVFTLVEEGGGGN